MTFTPKLIALDIDGTLFTPLPDTGYSAEEVTPAVRAAIDRAVEAGCHVVLASGRAPLSMGKVLQHLRLPRNGHQGDGQGNGRGQGNGQGPGGGQALVVASNGAVTFSYPPVEVLEPVQSAGPVT